MALTTTVDIRSEPDIGADAEKAIYSKVSWHILPLLFVAYVFAFIDRINISFAKLQMQQELDFSNHVFALGAAMFFVGYLIFEVPSNLLLEKIGVRKTFLRIMVCWGTCATMMAWVTTPWQFYVLRFLLGAFEAGFFPGMILYLTFWYPPARRGRVLAILLTATTFASSIIGPVNGALLKFGHGALGFHGWQWMFILNGLPCIFIGVIAFFVLSDGPLQARWLTQDEKKILVDRLERGRVQRRASGRHALHELLADRYTYVFAAIAFLHNGAVFALVFWEPTLIQSWGVKDVFHVGLLKTIPAIVGAIGMVLISWHSDRMHERRWHYVCCIGLIVISLSAIAMVDGGVVVSMLFLSISTIGKASILPLMYAFVSTYLAKETAAGGIALIGSVASVGPVVSLPLHAWILTSTGSNDYGLYFIAMLYAAAGMLMAFAAPRIPRPN